MKRSNTFTMWCVFIICCFTCDDNNLDENKENKNESENKL